MATAWFGPCPHCRIALSYLQGVTGSSMSPKGPACRKLVEVPRPTFLMVDRSAPTLHLKAPRLEAKL
jgi:hypothetical protein